MSRTKKAATALRTVPADPPDIVAINDRNRRKAEQLIAIFNANPAQMEQDLDELFNRVEVLLMAAEALRDGYEHEISSNGAISLAGALDDLWRFMWNGSTLNEPLRSVLADGRDGLDNAAKQDGAR